MQDRLSAAPWCCVQRTKGISMMVGTRSLRSFAGAFVLALGSIAHAVELHVPADHTSIQAAINASADGDTIIVAPGTYNELVRLNGKAITLRSESGAGQTIIDGGALGTTMKFVNAETSATVLEQQIWTPPPA